MSPVLREAELEFNFSSAVHAVKFDAKGVPKPDGLKQVDFIVEEEQRRLIVEVKDPFRAGANPARSRGFIHNLMVGEGRDGGVVQKGRDTYTFLHLMKEDDKPLHYVVVVAMDNAPQSKETLLTINDRLSRGLKQEGAVPWRRTYIAVSLVLDLEGWNKHFPQYPARRVPLSSATPPPPP